MIRWSSGGRTSGRGGIFELSNHPSVREVSFNHSPITWSEHKKWFERMRREPLRGFYVMEIDGALAGQIRFRLEGTLATVSISIDPRYRGMRCGSFSVPSGAGRFPSAASRE